MPDFTTLAAWGEFLVGIAILVALIYLAGQIRQNSRLLQASTSAVVSERSTAAAILMIQDPEVARIFWDGRADRDALSEADRERFNSILALSVLSMNLEYHLWRDGAVSAGFWETRRRALSWLLQGPGMQQWWSESRGLYDDEFRDFFYGLIRENQAAM